MYPFGPQDERQLNQVTEADDDAFAPAPMPTSEGTAAPVPAPSPGSAGIEINSAADVDRKYGPPATPIGISPAPPSLAHDIAQRHQNFAAPRPLPSNHTFPDHTFPEPTTAAPDAAPQTPPDSFLQRLLRRVRHNVTTIPERTERLLQKVGRGVQAAGQWIGKTARGMGRTANDMFRYATEGPRRFYRETREKWREDKKRLREFRRNPFGMKKLEDASRTDDAPETKLDTPAEGAIIDFSRKAFARRQPSGRERDAQRVGSDAQAHFTRMGMPKQARTVTQDDLVQNVLDRAFTYADSFPDSANDPVARNQHALDLVMRQRNTTVDSRDIIHASAEHYLWARREASEGFWHDQMMSVGVPAHEALKHVPGLEWVLRADRARPSSRPTGLSLRWGFKGQSDGRADRKKPAENAAPVLRLGSSPANGNLIGRMFQGAKKLMNLTVPNDGDLTGPFYPNHWTKTHDENPDRVIARHQVTVFVNGVNTSFADHHATARRIADQTRRPVVGVYNATGIAPGASKVGGVAGMLRDVGQVMGDKILDIGGNPATKTLVGLMRRHGEGLNIEAHSQGSVIVSEALRQARKQTHLNKHGEDAGRKVDLNRMKVTTWGNASFTFPKGPQYRHNVHEGDAFAATLGTASPLSRLMHGTRLGRAMTEAVVGPIADAPADTRILKGHGAYIEPHLVNQPGRGPGDIGNDYLDHRRDFAAAPLSTAGDKAGVFSPLLSAVRAFLPQFLGGTSALSTMEASGKAKSPPPFAPPGPPPFPNPTPTPNLTPVPTLLSAPRSAPTATPNSGIQRMGIGGGSGATDAALSLALDPGLMRASLLQQGGAGESPSGELRAGLAPHLGFDPSHARLHSGPVAAAAARNLNAEAFTIGGDVFFGDGGYDPHTPGGRGLIAHELMHVGQQTGAGGVSARAQNFSAAGGDAMEQEAQRVGQTVSSGGLALPQPPRIGNFAVSYDIQDRELPDKERARLGKIAQSALSEARYRLTFAGLPNAELEVVDCDVTLDLAEMSDEEATDAWATAIVDAVTAAVPASPVSAAASGVQRSALQRAESEPSLGKAALTGLMGGLLIAGGGGALLVGAGIGLAAMAAYDVYRYKMGKQDVAFQQMSESFGLQRNPVPPGGKDPADAMVEAMSPNERMAEAGLRAIPLAPAEVADVMAEIFTLKNIAIMAGIFAALAALNYTPVGWLFDGIALGYTIAMVGPHALEGLKIIAGAVYAARSAKSNAALNQIAQQIALGAAIAGVNGLMLFLACRAVKQGPRPRSQWRGWRNVGKTEPQTGQPPSEESLDPHNAAQFEKYKQSLREQDPSSKTTPDGHNAAQAELLKQLYRRQMEKPRVKDTDLKAILNKVYRPDAKIGSGSTAEAVRQEIATRKPTIGADGKPTWHWQKANELAANLRKWLKQNPNASAKDRIEAENVLLDTMEALSRQGHPKAPGGAYEFNMVEKPGPLAANVFDAEGNLNASSPALNFSGGKYNLIRIDKSTILYRAGTKGAPFGNWFTREPLGSEIQVRDMLAVKQYWRDNLGEIKIDEFGNPKKSPLDTVFGIEFPKGTVIYEGPTAGQGGPYLGGGNQIYIETPWAVKGTKVKMQKPLPHDSTLPSKKANAPVKKNAKSGLPPSTVKKKKDDDD